MPSPRVLIFDAGGTKLIGGVLDSDLTVHHRSRRLIAGLERDELLDIFAETVAEARAAAPDALAVGFGIPSVIDRGRGLSVESVHLPLDDLPFGAALEERVGLPVAWDNDTNLALLAELRLGAARGASEALMLTIGTGIGGALVLGGELYRGSVGAAGELGHMVVAVDGPPCQGGCPNRGCLEVLASGTAIGREGAVAAEAAPDSALGQALGNGQPATGALVTALARSGDAVAAEVVELVGRRLGAGIASLVNVFNPEVVVLGGGAMGAGDLLLRPARAVVGQRALRPSRDGVRIVPARFGDEAGLMGAGLAAFEVAEGEEGEKRWR
ncbi:MAG TPA: ROK family protein [Thermoleophilaceae bacterium]|nr:ROK family protein [Thermoleophilaceae bacterium]